MLSPPKTKRKSSVFFVSLWQKLNPVCLAEIQVQTEGFYQFIIKLPACVCCETESRLSELHISNMEKCTDGAECFSPLITNQIHNSLHWRLIIIQGTLPSRQPLVSLHFSKIRKLRKAIHYCIFIFLMLLWEYFEISPVNNTSRNDCCLPKKYSSYSSKCLNTTFVEVSTTKASTSLVRLGLCSIRSLYSCVTTLEAGVRSWSS